MLEGGWTGYTASAEPQERLNKTVRRGFMQATNFSQTSVDIARLAPATGGERQRQQQDGKTSGPTAHHHAPHPRTGCGIWGTGMTGQG